MNNQIADMKLTVLITSVALGLAAVTASAHFGGFGPGPINAEQHEAVEAAIEAGDYQAWVNATEGSRMSEVITEDTFDTLVQMHEAKESGDIETAIELKSELGIGGPFGRGHHGLRALNDGKGFTDTNGDGFCDHQDRVDEESEG